MVCLTSLLSLRNLWVSIDSTAGPSWRPLSPLSPCVSSSVPSSPPSSLSLGPESASYHYLLLILNSWHNSSIVHMVFVGFPPSSSCCKLQHLSNNNSTISKLSYYYYVLISSLLPTTNIKKKIKAKRTTGYYSL